MMKDKIIQIIPAPKGMKVRLEDAETEGGAFTVHIDCLALVEDYEGHRHITPLSMDHSTGVFDDVAELSNLIEIYRDDI